MMRLYTVLQVAVRDYMVQANRPYSYINVFDNLHKKIPKGKDARRHNMRRDSEYYSCTYSQCARHPSA